MLRIRMMVDPKLRGFCQRRSTVQKLQCSNCVQPILMRHRTGSVPIFDYPVLKLTFDCLRFLSGGCKSPDPFSVVLGRGLDNPPTIGMVSHSNGNGMFGNENSRTQTSAHVDQHFTIPSHLPTEEVSRS